MITQSSRLRPGVRLALDWGKARIGVAACDYDCLLSYPVETVKNNKNAVTRLVELVGEYEPMEVLIGLPIDLRGDIGIAANAIISVAIQLAALISPIPVRVVDERLSTAEATRRLSHTGLEAKQRRRIIDQQAAVGILDRALAIESRTGRLATPIEQLSGNLELQP